MVGDTVWRHGGRASDDWRLVYEERPGGRDAKSVYFRHENQMRQGGVELRRNGVPVLRRVQAPRLRTRW